MRLEPEDLADLERTLFRALVRAVRLLVKEGTWPGAVATAEAAAATPEPGPEDDGPPLAERDSPAFLRPVPPATVYPLPGKEPAPPKEKKKRRSALDVVPTVANRPSGYMATDEVYNMIGTSSPSGTLSTWIQNREVKAAIVTNVKPPTKGLPGRLMVDRDSLREREKLRRENARRVPIERTAAPRFTEE